MRLYEAHDWLVQRGVEATQKTWGVMGYWPPGSRRYEFRLGLSHDGGFETGVIPAPGPATWWIHAATLDEMLQMFLDAQADVDAGRATTWLEGLRARDPFRWMDPDVPEPIPPQ